VVELEDRMSLSLAGTRKRIRIAGASLFVGPLVMTLGDLIHPKERMDPAEQIAILMNDAVQWFASHLLLFIGIILAIPGLLALADMAEQRRPATGYAARILVVIGLAAFAAIFVAEMLIGRFITDGADAATATSLWSTMFSGPMLAAVMPAMLAFFVGIALLAMSLVPAGGLMRWAAVLYVIGSLLILAEILSAQVILSQIGNALILCGGSLAALLVLRGDALLETRR
jgi:hypothetical protein